MTYRELWEILVHNKAEDQDVTFYDRDEFFLCAVRFNQESDVLDTGHVYLIPIDLGV